MFNNCHISYNDYFFFLHQNILQYTKIKNKHVAKLHNNRKIKTVITLKVLLKENEMNILFYTHVISKCS